MNRATLRVVDNKQIEQLKKDQKELKDAAAARRAMAVLLFVSKLDVSLSGYTKDHAKRLRRQYLKEGIEAFRDKRTSQRDRILTKAEREKVVEVLKTKEPKEVITGSGEERWSTSLLGEYILELTGKKYKSKTSHYLLFHEAKLTWHKPGKVYEKADPKQKIIWEKETKPKLEIHWNDANTVILCEDEMVLTSSTTTQKIWLPKGQYPSVIETNGTRKRKSFYGFLNLKTGKEHTFITDWQNMFITVDILTKIRNIYPTQKLVLIWDNCGWHRGSKVTEWIKQDGNTETIYFPPYTPQLNPQEHVWKEGRRHVTHNEYITKIEEIADKFKNYIEKCLFDYKLLDFKPSVSGQV